MTCVSLSVSDPLMSVEVSGSCMGVPLCMYVIKCGHLSLVNLTIRPAGRTQKGRGKILLPRFTKYHKASTLHLDCIKLMPLTFSVPSRLLVLSGNGLTVDRPNR